MVQRFGTRRLLAPILVLLCATALIILWLDGKKPGIDLLASFVNAALFLALGIIVRDINLYRSSYKSFIEVFHGIESKLSSNGHGSFMLYCHSFASIQTSKGRLKQRLNLLMARASAFSICTGISQYTNTCPTTRSL